MSHPYRGLVEHMLAKFGGLYTFNDILELIEEGHMQSFAYGDSWAVTQICEFPRKRVLDIVLCVGDLEELAYVESDVTGFAREHGLSMMTSNARLGFQAKMLPGWKMVSATYVKDLSDGPEDSL